MVNSEIPKNYTASPSSLAGTPQLRINREAALDIDSSNAFEGPEKLLEVWFAPSADTLPVFAKENGLKAVSAGEWTEMLDLVHCKVLSIVESPDVDAYLLSESSMFVFAHKLVLKTCGTTTLLLGLPKILEIAALSAGFPHVPANPATMKMATASVHRVFYSRKNFLFPDQQRGPHRSWRDEVRTLDSLFQRGSAYMIGKMNGEHWYLYITEPDTYLTPPDTPEHEKVNAVEAETKRLQLPEGLNSIGSGSSLRADGSPAEEPEDETLEILMTDLDVETAKQFYMDHAVTVAEGKHQEKMRDAMAASQAAMETIEDASSFPSTDCGEGDYDVFSEQTKAEDFGAVAGGDVGSATPDETMSEGHALGSVVSETCGLSNVYPKDKYPEARIDAYLFAPCGFSANGVVPAATGETARSEEKDGRGGGSSTHYFTVHVTPEPQCSYASFETNVPARQTGRETAEVVEEIVNIFRPGRFSVTLFEAKGGSHGEVGAGAGGAGKKRTSGVDAVRGYRRMERIVHDLDGYDLIFRYYERHDWRGGKPRLGEAY